MVRLEKINGKNFRQCIKLEVDENQKNFVASNVVSLAQAYISTVEKDCIAMPYAIYNDDTMVGFVMLSYETADKDDIADEDAYSIWRMMIDKKYQGKGYGRAAMEHAIDIIRTFPYGKTRIAALSYEPENHVAKKLYESLGFKETGEVVEGEMLAILEL